MEFFLFALSFFGSVAITIFLRRLDKPSYKIAQIKRLGEVQSLQLEEVAESNVKTIRDAMLDFEMLTKASQRSQSELRQEIISFQEKIQEIKNERSVIDQVSEDLSQIAENARVVSEQVRKLDDGLERLGFAEKEIQTIQKRLDETRNNLEKKSSEADQKLGQAIQHLIDEATERTQNFEEQSKLSFQLLKDDLKTLSMRIEEEAQESDLIGEKLASFAGKLEDKFSFENNRMDERFQSIERKIQDRITLVETGISNIRANAVESLQNDLSQMRGELEGFNLDAISKRDEILNEARRMAEGISGQIGFFETKVVGAENKLIKMTEQYRQTIAEKLEEYDSKWQDTASKQTQRLDEEVDLLHRSIEDSKSTEIDSITREATKQKEELRSLAEQITVRLEREREIGEEGLRSSLRDEEKRMDSHRQELTEIVEDLEAKIQDLEKVQNLARSLAQEVRGEIQEQEKLSLEVIEQTTERSLQMQGEHIEQLEKTADEHIEQLEKSADRFFEEQEGKISRLNSTIEEKISREIASLAGRGQLQIDELEKRTTQTIRDAKDRMEQSLDNARKEFSSIKEEVTKEVLQAQRIRDGVISDIQSDGKRIEEFQEKLRVLDKAEDLLSTLDDAVDALSGRLSMIQDESNRIDEYVRNFESLRVSRKEMESELRLMETHKARISEAEDQFRLMDRQIQELRTQLSHLEDLEGFADRIEDRATKLSEFQKNFEKYFQEALEKRKYLENAIRFIEKSKGEVKKVSETAEELLEKVDRAEIRQDDVNRMIQNMEQKATTLGRIDQEAQKIEARFEQMEGLMHDLEEKQKQIGTMFKRIDELSEHGNDMKSELESMLGEADEKLGQLSSFYQTIDNMWSERMESDKEELVPVGAKAPKGKKAQASALAEWRKEGILSLYLNHKWDADLIANRMKLDPAIVRAVISSHGG